MVTTVGPMAALLFFVPLWGPQVALRGLASGLEPNKTTKPSSKFGIADVMILMAFIALANVLATTVNSDSTSVSFTFLAISANALAILVWFRCLEFMKARNIEDARKRAIVQIVVFPGAVLSVAYALISTLMLGSTFLNAPQLKNPDSQTALVVIVCMLGVSIACIFAVRTIYVRFVLGPG